MRAALAARAVNPGDGCAAPLRRLLAPPRLKIECGSASAGDGGSAGHPAVPLVIRRAAGAVATLVALALNAAPARAQIFDDLLEAGEKAAEVAGKARSVLPIGTEEEVGIGRGVAATLAGYYTLERDEELTAYLNLVGHAVAAVEPRGDIAYRFGVLASDEVNALAAPGGYILVTRGALALMEDEAELAGVLAHEVAHVNEKHVIQEVQKRARTSLGAEVAQDALDADSEVFDEIVGLGTSVLFLGLSREDELEADSIGTAYAAAAGYDPSGLRRFVSKLKANESQAVLSALRATHPKPDDRLALLDRQVSKAEAGGARLPERFQAALRGEGATVGARAPAARTPSAGG